MGTIVGYNVLANLGQGGFGRYQFPRGEKTLLNNVIVTKLIFQPLLWPKKKIASSMLKTPCYLDGKLASLPMDDQP